MSADAVLMAERIACVELAIERLRQAHEDVAPAFWQHEEIIDASPEAKAELNSQLKKSLALLERLA